MKAKIYVKFDDPGHGWLAVKRKELAALGLLDKISIYSYQRGATVYLEEDCDMSTFYKAKTWCDCTHWLTKTTDRLSHIRGYDHFQITEEEIQNAKSNENSSTSSVSTADSQ